MVPLAVYLSFSALLFIIGLVGILIRRNLIVLLMCIELMLNAINITLAAFSRAGGNIHGQIFAVFVITIAAAEAAVGLAVILVVFRQRKTVKVDEFNLMKW